MTGFGNPVGLCRSHAKPSPCDHLAIELTIYDVSINKYPFCQSMREKDTNFSLNDLLSNRQNFIIIAVLILTVKERRFIISNRQLIFLFAVLILLLTGIMHEQ